MTLSADWIVPDWPAPAVVRSLITTRNGGVSTGPFASFNLGLHTGDDPVAVQHNRTLLRALLPQDPKWLQQVHGTVVVDADNLKGTAEADGAVARTAGTVCAVLVADCMPVLLCDRAGTVVGVAHAGWRGLSGGIVEATVREMRVASDELLAYLGPAIGASSFEVGNDVREAFLAADPLAEAAFQSRDNSKWLADLYRLARRRLASCGVRRVFGAERCTYKEPAYFYSYRRDRTTGRMAALIWIAPH